MLLCISNVIKEVTMGPTVQKLQTYCKDVLGIHLEPKPWIEAGALPLFLRDAYDFYQIDLLKTPCLLAVDRRTDEQPPATIKKQLEQLHKKWEHHIVYMRPRITSYNRQRLIKQQVPFVVPGNQMFLPMLCVDLRERFGETKEAKQLMAPSTQALVLYVLNRPVEGPMTPGVMAGFLGVTAMTMTRAFAELERLGLGEHVVEPKRRQLTFPERPQDLWERALPLMRTPVKERLFLRRPNREIGLKAAGQTALAHYSMIAEPMTPVYACGAESWKNLRLKFQMIPYPDEGAFQLEIWRYPPELFAKDGTVDQLDLFLAMREDKDERIAAALEEMMERRPW
jgi:hypothetical protein